MARRRRNPVAGLYHVLNRGVEKRIVFLDRADYVTFDKIVLKSMKLYRCKIEAFAYMPNHYHLLLRTSTDNLSLIMQRINSNYSIYFNRKYDRIGHLWQGRYKSFIIDNPHYHSLVIKYIENNPVKSKIVSKIGDWEFTSRNLLSDENHKWSIADETIWKKILENGKTYHEESGSKLSERIKLSEILSCSERDAEKIHRAVTEGYKQCEIADYLGLSKGMISRKINQIRKMKTSEFGKL